MNPYSQAYMKATTAPPPSVPPAPSKSTPHRSGSACCALSLTPVCTLLAEGVGPTSCDFCRSQKRRCDRQRPCGSCTARRVECVYTLVDSTAALWVPVTVDLATNWVAYLPPASTATKCAPAVGRLNWPAVLAKSLLESTRHHPVPAFRTPPPPPRALPRLPPRPSSTPHLFRLLIPGSIEIAWHRALQARPP